MSVTVRPLTATPLAASETAAPPTLTTKALVAGTLLESRGSLNVISSEVPSSFADSNVGFSLSSQVRRTSRVEWVDHSSLVS